MVSKGTSFLFMVCVCLCGFLQAPLSAQEAEEPEDEVPIDSDWSGIMPSLYTRGDQTLNISLGVLFPMFFVGNAGILDNKVSIAGTFSLAYNYFLSSHLYVGGEFELMAAGTLGKNMLYMVPFGLRAGYQAVVGRFEFPFTLTVGAAPQRYLEEGYFGFFMKGMASGFFRFNMNWSFGLNTAWWWVPEWTKENAKDVQGHFLELTLAARYHF
ncbi:MAG: hypothetical protein LBU25_09680 [Treponema sp.]|jgi:hypothetical protein|nr:hypothetical protein [Treponema sp.]